MINKPNSRQSLVANITRLYPFYSGSSQLANHKLVRQISGSSDDLIWSNVPGGKVLAPLNDYVGRSAFYLGDLDRKLTWICNRLVTPGDTVLDIGANIGIMTLLLSKLVSEKGIVHAFEPNPKLCETLQKTITYNQISNICLHSIALGSEEGSLKLKVPKYNAGAASLIRNKDLTNCQTFEVSVRSLSKIVSENKISKIRLIKIDVEGFEAQVLKGGDKVLNSIRPEAIIFELNEKVPNKPIEHPVIEILANAKYKFLSIPKCLLKMHLKKFNPYISNEIISHDFLAVREESYENISKLVKAIP